MKIDKIVSTSNDVRLNKAFVTVTKTNNRILWIDILKFTAIILVIWGHIIQYGYEDYLDNSVHQIIYSFHMPLFMMLSGFFGYSVLKLSYSQLLKKKFEQLIIPCIGVFVIACAIDVYQGGG